MTKETLSRVEGKGMKFKPHKYQVQAMKFLLEHACGGLLLDPG